MTTSLKTCFKCAAEKPRTEFYAHNSVSNALRDGRMSRPDCCSSCGCSCRPEAHHCDYTKPLEVMWLCKSCHVAWHLINKPLYLEAA